MAAGTRVGRYEIIAPLDSGGMGEVYRARRQCRRRALGRDGRELFFVSGESMVRVTTDFSRAEPDFGTPETLFDEPPSPTESTFGDYDHDRRNDRFLITRPPRGAAEHRELAVSVVWATRLQDELRARSARR